MNKLYWICFGIGCSIVVAARSENAAIKKVLMCYDELSEEDMICIERTNKMSIQME